MAFPQTESLLIKTLINRVNSFAFQMIHHTCVLIFFSVFLCVLCKSQINNYPVIGIFTQPSESNDGNCRGDCLMLAASYVKQVESSGARVVPVNYYASDDEIKHLFSSLNGFIFPGGGAGLPPAAQLVYDLTIEANDNGDFMPLWGTCLGFEWLLMCTTRNQNILDPTLGSYDAFNYSLSLDFTSSAKDSRLFGPTAPAELYDILASQNVTFNSHHEGIYPAHFSSNSALSSFYSVLSTNKDRKGKPFVSTIEAFDYPVYGVQWHPEKNRYE